MLSGARQLWIIVGTAALAHACGGDSSHGPDDDGFTGGIEPPPGAVAQFTRMPVDYPLEGTIEPLGHLNPPGHVLPTDHVYFYPVDYDHPPAVRDTITRTVYAPATGKGYVGTARCWAIILPPTMPPGPNNLRS